MKIIMAPILPHLSEELYEALEDLAGASTENKLSVFTEGWRSVVRSHSRHTVMTFKIV